MTDVIRIKRRSSGGAGAPASLAYAELAFNEVDNILYYGRGNNAGQAVTIIPIAGPGFVSGGDVTGPAGATDNAVVRFDTTTGKLIQNSIMTLADDGTLVITIGGQTVFRYDPNSNNGTVFLGAKPPHGQTISYCARSDITGSARFFGAANYGFDAGLDVSGAINSTSTITSTASGTQFRANGSAGSSRAYVFTTSLTPRWTFECNAAAESGSNVGSDWSVSRFSDGGSYIDSPFVIIRSTGNVQFQNNLAVYGSLSLPSNPLAIASGGTGAATSAIALDNLSGASGATTGVLTRASAGTWSVAAASGGASISVGDTPPASPTDNSLWWETDSGILWLRYNDGNTTQWTSIAVPPGPTMGFLPLSGGSLSGGLTIAPSSGDANLDLRKATAANYNTIYGRTGTSARWCIIPGDGTSEAGSNAGSDFQIQRYDDNGTVLGTALTIKRSTGAVTITTDFFAPGPGRFCVVNYDIGATFGTRKGYIDGTNGYISTDGQISAAMSIIGYAGTKSFIAQAVAASPQATMIFRCPAQPANQRDWELIHGSGGNFTLRAISDDYASSNNVWEITRGSGVAIGRLNINTPTTITGNTFSPANPGAAALLVGGSYGGGIMHNDNNVFAGHWTDSFGAALRFGCGGTASSIAQTFYISTTTTYNISGAWATISDASVKENIVPYTRGLSAIVELEPIEFTYFQGPFAREVNDPRIGLVAQQVEPHMPEIVGSTEITVDDKPQTVSTLEPGVIIFALINAMKEVSSRLEAVEAALKNV